MSSLDRARVGIVGLGSIGLRVAGHARRSGFAVIGYDVRDGAMKAASDEGIATRPTPAAIAEESDVVLIYVVNDAQVLDVTLGDSRLLAHARNGAVIVISSSVHPDTVRRVAHEAAPAGVSVLDAPTTGGEHTAVDGTMTYLVGGDAEAFDRARPALATSAAHIVHTGDIGTGQLAKMANNLMLWAQYAGTREALAMVETNGLDVDWLAKVLAHSTGNNWPLQHWFGFQNIPWASKDLETVRQMAEEFGLSTPVSTFLRDYMRH